MSRRMSPTTHLFAAIVVITTTFVPVAHAHENMTQNWCASSSQPQPLIVGQFAYTPTQLAAFKSQIVAQAKQLKVCPATILGITVMPLPGDSCGIVDDWHYANQLSRRYCRNLTPNLPETDSALNFVGAPADFNNLEGHHTEYRFGDGTLTGHCVVCTGSTGGPGDPGGN